MEYVKNKDLKRSLKESKEGGKLTSETVKMFTLIVEGMAKTRSYKYPEDRQDCIAFGMEDLLKYWNRYNPDVSDNAFAFISQIAKNGMQKGWKKIHSTRSIKAVPFSRMMRDDDSNMNV